jgi:hypothetical protein
LGLSFAVQESLHPLALRGKSSGWIHLTATKGLSSDAAHP